MDDGSGGRSRRCEYGGETNASPAGLTLGGILSIKQTPPYRIHERTLLDLIRDDQSCRKESKKMWKMLREKFRLKLAGSVCTTTVPTLASHVHVTGDSNRVVSPPVNDTSSVPPDTENVNVQTEVLVEERERTSPEEDRVAGGGGGGEGGEPTAARMSLMSLLEVEGSVYFDDDDDEEEEVEEEDEAVVDGGRDGGGGGGYRYNNCCVCMVRHKGAAFIPCGHTFCRLCSRELFVKRASCPLCNNFILEILDIF